MRLSILAGCFLFALASHATPAAECDGEAACTRRCDAGDAEACNTLAMMLARTGDDASVARGVAYFGKACDAGLAVGCHNLAGAVAAGYAGAPDPVRAATLYAKACEGGRPASCARLAEHQAAGNGVPVDAAKAKASNEKAVALYEAQCRKPPPRSDKVAFKNAGIACLAAGNILDKPEKMPGGLGRAAELFRLGCALDNEDACYNRAVMLQNGEGVAADLPAAARLFDRTCRAGLPNGCSNLGTLHFGGRGVEKDLAKAAALFTKACDADVPIACSNLAVLRSKQGDQAEATRLYGRACRLGLEESCGFYWRRQSGLP